MKPNKPLDRESLLQLVRQRLERVAENSPQQHQDITGRVVRQLMHDLSQPTPAANSDTVNAVPVPVNEVAAYVDGSLNDLQKQRAITEAATTDPGLMMEIVAALRSQRELRSRQELRREETSQPEELSPDLRSRLIELQHAQGLPRQRPQPQPAATPPLVQTSPTRTPTTTPGKGIPIALIATAAVALFAVGWWARSELVPDGDPVTQERRGTVIPDRDRPIESNDLATDQPNRQGPVLAEIPDVDSAESPETPTSPPSSAPLEIDAPPSKVAVVPREEDRDAPMVAIESPSDGTAGPSESPRDRSPQTDTRRTGKLVARWSQIDGLLLRSDSAPPGERASASQSGPASVAVGSEFELAGDGSGRAMTLQTLPLCRATAMLEGGGELVIAADTQLELTPAGTINLLHGSIALLGIDQNRIVRLGRSLANSVALEGSTQRDASPQQQSRGGEIVVQKTLNGMQVDVTGGPVNVNSQSFTDSRLNLQGPLLAVERIDDAPERLPRWTRERVDRIEVGRNVLAQLSESPNVPATLMQTLASGAVRGDAAATLRGWLVASSGDHLLRLIGSPDPLIREAALQHLRTVGPTDPRHRQIWRRLQVGGNNARTFATVRSLFVNLWSGRRPNATQREQLLRLLQAPEPAARATANYLLRSFYGPGPPFDLNASAAARTRTVNAWRVVISRVSDQR
ncbi:hypothetical protein Mal15_02510 [Stieleria maiorica]|uniref:Uncharacterized protein n=1 Tax=Stieleria maiorica TaxID=2795974 RepID=A0A5B9M9J2_9BACT|nr:hypothetical protein [Stieleria maiorica]QEF96224.1 hypothetical protein Mal15_02510 [Stieleria maiorica]